MSWFEKFRVTERTAYKSVMAVIFVHMIGRWRSHANDLVVFQSHNLIPRIALGPTI